MPLGDEVALVGATLLDGDAAAQEVGEVLDRLGAQAPLPVEGGHGSVAGAVPKNRLSMRKSPCTTVSGGVVIHCCMRGMAAR